MELLEKELTDINHTGTDFCAPLDGIRVTYAFIRVVNGLEEALNLAEDDTRERGRGGDACHRRDYSIVCSLELGG